MKVLHRDEVSGLCGKQGHLLSILSTQINNTGLQKRSLRDRNQKCSWQRILNMKAHKENVLCCGLQEKTHGIVFQFLTLFLTVLLDYANKKTPLPPLILFLCLLNFFSS